MTPELHSTELLSAEPQNADRSPVPAARRINRKSFLAKQFTLWHWVTSAVCLVAMLFFSFTGITLNHAASLKGKPNVTERTGTLPQELHTFLSTPDQDRPNDDDTSIAKNAPLPIEIVTWFRRSFSLNLRSKIAEWSEDEIYVSLPRPGGDAWLTIDRATGDIVYEVTTNGPIAYLNDLHKGRNTGTAWAWFIDIFSVASIVFSLTGLGLLWVHSRRRPSTWPFVIAGVVIPVLIMIFFIH